MADFIAFLRAVNVPRRIVRMAELREHLTASGFGGVETYIQSGNLRFSADEDDRGEVGRRLEKTIEDGWGFPVPAMVFTPEEVAEVYADAGRLTAPFEEARRYVMFLQDEPDPDLAAAVDAWAVDGEKAAVHGRAVHVWLAKSTHQARFSNSRFEKLLGVQGTLRDLKVVAAVAQRWASA